MEYLLEYAYNGVVYVPFDQVESVTQAAEMLQIYGIRTVFGTKVTENSVFDLDKLQIELASKNTTLRLVPSEKKFSKRKSPPKKFSPDQIEEDDEDDPPTMVPLRKRQCPFDSGLTINPVVEFLEPKSSTGRSYTKEDMEKALDSLRERRLSLTRASEAFGIPATTLWQRANRMGIATPKKETANKTWSDKDMNSALNALRNREISANKAAKLFKIPSSVSMYFHFVL